jgi:CubicO group peptidase (beta-lactamase class C family)
MKKTFLLTVAILLLSMPFVKAQTDVQKAAKIDSILQVYTNKNMFCGSALVAKGGKVLLSKGYGMANFSYDVPNTNTTKFKLASVSKQFTAMAIMMLEEKGKLSTEDKLSKYLSDYPLGDKITLRNLLTHTSGIADFTGLPLYDSVMTLPHTMMQEFNYVKKLPLEFGPGAKFKYSNTGYVLLSYIIEQVSKKTYGDFIKENIFIPLQMKNSGLYTNNEVLKNVAVGYTNNNGVIEQANYIDMSIPTGAGALYSTVEDMYLWDRSWYTEKLVKKSTLEKMLVPYKEDYAYGWMVDTFKTHKWVFHTGGIQGFATVINRFPDDDVCIIILKNVDNYTMLAANKVARSILFNEKYELPVERKEVDINKKVYEKLVGDYELMPGFILSLTTDGKGLYSQATGQPKLELHPESEYKYFLKEVDAQLEFMKDAKGKIISVTLFQGGQQLNGKKK